MSEHDSPPGALLPGAGIAARAIVRLYAMAKTIRKSLTGEIALTFVIGRIDRGVATFISDDRKTKVGSRVARGWKMSAPDFISLDGKRISAANVDVAGQRRTSRGHVWLMFR